MTTDRRNISVARLSDGLEGFLVSILLCIKAELTKGVARALSRVEILGILEAVVQP